ncbi:MAG: hypothetical protein AB7I59_05665 [Geminicoccaceae bacterium]
MSSVGDLVRARPTAHRKPAARTIRIGQGEEERFAQGLGLGLLLSLPFWLGAAALMLLH